LTVLEDVVAVPPRWESRLTARRTRGAAWLVTTGPPRPGGPEVIRGQGGADAQDPIRVVRPRCGDCRRGI